MKDTNLLRSNGVDLDQSLELLGDMEMYDETLNDFLTELEERLPKMEKFKNDADLGNYAILVHSMKSDSKYLGFTKLAELSFQHEMESKANNFDYVSSHYDELMSEVNRLMDVAHQYLEN